VNISGGSAFGNFRLVGPMLDMYNKTSDLCKKIWDQPRGIEMYEV
jgi:hypothetical protein